MIDAAHKAFQSWRLVPGPKRGELVRLLGEELRADLRRIHDHAGVTTVFVTHDQEEAFAVADLVAVMKDGRIEQYGAPAAVRRNPRTALVSEFLAA